MDEILLKNRLSFWKILADKNKPIKNDPFIRFMIYWLIFDGYLSEVSGCSSDSAKLKWFYKNNTALQKKFNEHFASSTGKCAIKFFKDRGGVEDMRPGANGVRKQINDSSNLQEIFEVIYQVRCNLFHGAKNRMSGKNEDIVRAALSLIKLPINLWLSK